jgi:hypothetical protein
VPYFEFYLPSFVLIKVQVEGDKIR